MTTIQSVFSRNNVLNALLALATAIEFIYDMGERIGTWYRNGGKEQLKTALVYTVAAIIWMAQTIRLGVESVRTNAPQWIINANELRNSIGKQFTYAV